MKSGHVFDFGHSILFRISTLGFRISPPGRPGHPAEGWVVFFECNMARCIYCAAYAVDNQVSA